MTFDLRRIPWLPLRRLSGLTEWGTIASSVAGPANDPIVAIASPRPDFDGAVTEFLAGLLTAAFMVESEAAWRELWRNPPSESELQARFDALPDAFDLDGDGPRFMQDFSATDLASQPVEPIQNLLVNAKNSGLFIKPNTVRMMSRPAAAMALLTMQTYSTAGGRGYRTSVRGGGPLTTLVDPRRLDQPEASLWRRGKGARAARHLSLACSDQDFRGQGCRDFACECPPTPGLLRHAPAHSARVPRRAGHL